jgi:hypothetical protein
VLAHLLLSAFVLASTSETTAASAGLEDDAVDLLAPYLGVTPLDADDLVEDARDDAPKPPHAHHRQGSGDAPLWSMLIPELHFTFQVNDLATSGLGPNVALSVHSGLVIFASATFGTAKGPPPLRQAASVRLISTPDDLQPASIDPSTPRIGEVQAAAERAALVHLDDLSGWKTRARAAAWLPSLEADYRRNVGEIDTLGVSSNLGIDSHNLEDVTRYGVRASWQLSQLVFSPEEVSAAQAALDVEQHRQDLVAHVTELYFERLRAILKLRQAAPRDTDVLILSVAELTAKIDALTNGFLSERLKAGAP